jgi:hypothetical protein
MWEVKRLLCILAALAALGSAASMQTPDDARIERHGDSSVISAHTFRPLDAIAGELHAQFGIPVSAEDPIFQFRGDLMDISPEVPRLRPGTLVPARWGLEVTFPVNPDGSPKNVRELLKNIVAEANRQAQFAYRLDETEGVFFFVPTRSHDAQGQSIAMPALLDRPVTIQPGLRRVNESAALMSADLARQTGLHVSCCQSSIGGFPWGMEQIRFGADHEPARSVLLRLGLRRWHVRCDENSCFIDMR